MRGFARRTPVHEVLARLDAEVFPLPPETVPLHEAAERVLAAPIVSTVDVPSFARGMMDGLAVRASDTSGASLYLRVPLAIVGAAWPGRPWDGVVAQGQAVRIMTGAPLPAGTDAVLPAEKVDWPAHAAGANRADGRPDEVHALDEVGPGQHVGHPGEDVSAGTTILNSSRRLRPQDVGLLSSIGRAEVPVVRRPRVRIVVTGDELLSAGTSPFGCRIADANGPMLAALVRRDGGLPESVGPLPDEPDVLLAELRRAADVVLVSGGSSVGLEDHAPLLLAEHGELWFHGLAMRPSSPAGLGRLDGRLVFLLPGNPVSCLCAYDFFAGRAIRRLGGLGSEWPYRQRSLPLRRKLVSTVGRLDYARVAIIDGAVEPLAISGASVLSSTTRADGFVVVPEDSEGFPSGAMVDVWLYP